MDKKTSDIWFKLGLLTFWSMLMYGLGAKDALLVFGGLGFMALLFIGDRAFTRITGSPADTDR
jgi:hypothetical protein